MGLAEWSEHKGIPLWLIVKTLPYMPYGDVLSVMTKHLLFTGCRITELDNMFMSSLEDNKIYWQIGKNQTGHRWEILPDSYLEELKFYRTHNKVFGDKMFGINNETYGRFFNRDMRPILPPEWLQMEKDRSKNRMNEDKYVYQIKGFRKTFQTVAFWEYNKKFEDMHMALLMVAKRMRHKSERITAVHYIQEFDFIQPWQWEEMCEFHKNKRFDSQEKLLAYV